MESQIHRMQVNQLIPKQENKLDKVTVKIYNFLKEIKFKVLG